MAALAEHGEVSTVDPRIRRTREALQTAIATLIESRSFDDLSVQEIAAAAGVNRATFYAHYPDKFALLECMVAGRFNALLATRGVVFNAGCSEALKGLVLGLCDFLAATPMGCSEGPQRQLAPHLETALVQVLKRMLLDGIREHPAGGDLTPDLQAAMMAGAMYAAAKHWVSTPGRCSAEHMAGVVVGVLGPMLGHA